MQDIDTFVPKLPICIPLWDQLSPQNRYKRLQKAQEREAALLEVLSCIESGVSERLAVKLLMPWTTRSSYRRWLKKYEAYGLEGLLDWRLPPTPETPSHLIDIICTLRRADPNVEVNSIVEHLKTHHEFTISSSTVRRILRQAGLSRRRGPVFSQPFTGEQRLELGGMKLIEAACVQTGYLDSLTAGVADIRKSALWSSEAFSERFDEVDTTGRDEQGRFLPQYNERYIKQEGDDIGPGFISVDEKRPDKDARLYHLSYASDTVLYRKMLALMVSPLLGHGRWDGIRVPRGELLGELCGYPYMPPTLELFTRELKYLEVSNTLWEIHARHWLDHSERWGGKQSSAILYIDETNKPVWTDLFSESTKVSNVGRVMPGLEIASFHTGYGVPLWMVTHSGRAPLVKVVPKLLTQLQQILEGAEVGRIVVIDAEANSVLFLKGLEQGTPCRKWVTRLKASILSGKRIFNRSNFRPYRDGDRIRMGECDLNDPEGGTFRVRIIEVEHRTKGTTTYLAASHLLRLDEWKDADIADLYFNRWPRQEANFRSLNQAVKFKDVHGYGKQLVDNISVVTELDKLEVRIRRLQEKFQQSLENLEAEQRELKDQEKLLRRYERRIETVGRIIKKKLIASKSITPKLQSIIDEQQRLLKDISSRREKVNKLQIRTDKTTAKANKEEQKLTANRAKQEELESRRRIYKHDVELDSIFSVLKVGLTLLVTYVLKEYFNDARMDTETFLERVATLTARLRYTPELEILTFDYNRRDPDVMAILAEHAEAINARKVKMRSGRILRIKVDPAPPPRIPPPKNRRTIPGDRFRRN